MKCVYVCECRIVVGIRKITELFGHRLLNPTSERWGVRGFLKLFDWLVYNTGSFSLVVIACAGISLYCQVFHLFRPTPAHRFNLFTQNCLCLNCLCWRCGESVLDSCHKSCCSQGLFPKPTVKALWSCSTSGAKVRVWTAAMWGKDGKIQRQEKAVCQKKGKIQELCLHFL